MSEVLSLLEMIQPSVWFSRHSGIRRSSVAASIRCGPVGTCSGGDRVFSHHIAFLRRDFSVLIGSVSMEHDGFGDLRIGTIG